MKKIDKYCINCNKQLLETNKSGYCRTCFNKIVKKTVKDKYCVGCGKLLNRYRPGKRCYSCNMINRRKENPLIGNNNPNYKGGLPKCLDCGKILSNRYNKRCASCARKGILNPWFGKTILIKFCKYNKVWFKSSWEANFAKWCDGSGIEWKYEPKAFKLELNNKTTHYTPDFYLPEFDLWIEVKGYWRKDAFEKYQQFQKEYKNINIELFNKDILMNWSIV